MFAILQSVLYCNENVGRLLKQSSIAVMIIPIISDYQIMQIIMQI